jgi:aspartate aminotransferase
MLSILGQTIQDSPTIALAQQARVLKTQGKDIIDLWTGHLDYEPPQALMQAMHDALETNNVAKYIPVAWLPALREQIAVCATNVYGQAIDQRNIIITNGAKTGIYEILLTLINPGEEVIVIAPYRPSYIEQIKLVWAVPVIVQSDSNCHMEIAAIQQAITSRTKLIITNSPNNPSGAVYDKHEWQTLLDTIRWTDIFLLSDEMYKDFSFDGFVSPLMIADEQIKRQIIVLDGLSKNIAIPGWRIGWVIAESVVIDAASKIQSNMTGNSNSLVQYGLVEFFANNDWSWVDAMRENLMRTKNMIEELLMASNIGFVQQQGALYFFVHIGTHDSIAFCQNLLENHWVAGIPGVYFGREHYIRICYAMDKDTVIAGVEKIIHALAV